MRAYSSAPEGGGERFSPRANLCYEPLVSEPILLAIDAGGTRTRCAISSGDGRILARAAGGAGNHILDGWDTARASFAAAIGEAISAAGAPRIDVAVAASAGVGPHGEGREIVESLLQELLPAAATRSATGDMVAALWGALRAGEGVVVSAGTGSVCFGRNGRGETRQVGGWGHLLGDEGSAYDIALRAMRAVARGEDGREPATALRALLLEQAGVGSPIELALQIYGEERGREHIATLAPLVAVAARQGDGAAIEILRLAAEELALAAETAMRVLGLEAGVVSYAGSVFDAGASILSPFAAHIGAAMPKARVESPFLPALGGALRLALRAIGADETPAILDRWRAELWNRAA